MSVDGRSLGALQIDQLCGTVAHRVIAASLRRHGPRPATVAELAELVAAEALPVRRNAASAVRAHVLSSAAVFQRRFMPPHGADLIDVELEVHGGRLDLVWSADGLIWSDEIKCGRTQAAKVAGSDMDQLAGQLGGARGHFGEAFAGIRVLFICAPRRSFLYDGRPAGAILDEPGGEPLAIRTIVERAGGARA